VRWHPRCSNPDFCWGSHLPKRLDGSPWNFANTFMCMTFPLPPSLGQIFHLSNTLVYGNQTNQQVHGSGNWFIYLLSTIKQTGQYIFSKRTNNCTYSLYQQEKCVGCTTDKTWCKFDLFFLQHVTCVVALIDCCPVLLCPEAFCFATIDDVPWEWTKWFQTHPHLVSVPDVDASAGIIFPLWYVMGSQCVR